MIRIFFFISSFFLFESCQPSYLDISLGVTEKSRLKPDFFSLLKAFGYDGKGDIESANDFCQKNFLRKETQERWQVTDDSNVKEKRDLILSFIGNNHFSEEIYPTSKGPYGSVVVLGATMNRLRSRLHFLKRLIAEGATFKKIYFLVGDRPRSFDVETDEVLYDEKKAQFPFQTDWKKPKEEPKTESDLARLAWEQIMPKKYEPHYVDAPLKGDKRPTTADTILLWLSQKPSKEKTLFISNNPYVSYQHSVILGLLLGNSFIKSSEMNLVETVGEEADPLDSSLKVHLDNLARTLYAEKSIWTFLENEQIENSFLSRVKKFFLLSS
jgi:hypothetical protein